MKMSSKSLQLFRMLVLLFVVQQGKGQLSLNFYTAACPNVEFLVQQAVLQKFNQTFITVPGTLRLFFHDCSVEAGGPSYSVELGRRDGLISLASRVPGNLPEPDMTLDQLNAIFSKNNLSQIDMIALSGAHTVGFSHCNHFSDRLYNFSSSSPLDPSVDPSYATQLMDACPRNVDPTIAINMDPTTPNTFDNMYFQNLVARKGLFTADQELFDDPSTQTTVTDFANNPGDFNAAFITAITKLGRVGVKTGNEGEIRLDCSTFNS